MSTPPPSGRTCAVQFIGSIVAWARKGASYTASSLDPALASAASASPSCRATAPGCSARCANSCAMLALETLAFAPSSQETSSASRPFFAGQYPSATTATPLEIWTTCRTPGTAFAFVASKRATLPPNTGQRAITATSIPGTFTSIPNWALPSTLGGVSRRRTRVPRIFQSFASLSGTSAGAGSAAALAASFPYVRRRLLGVWITAPFSARHAALSTPQVSAAALTSISRAAAPALRSGVNAARTLVLPPVPCMPNIGLMYALSAGADSMRIFDQSASSSSASSIGSDVVTPWPISERSTTTTTLSSAPMRSHAFGAKGAAAAARAPCRPPAGRWKPRTRPAPATPAASRNSRRLICAALMSRSLRGAMDGGADALVGAAATDVGHGRVDIGVRGMRILREQRRGGHDLPRLAVAALRHVFLDPRALHRVRAVLGEPFDRGHPFAGDGGHGQYAGARRDAVQVDGAGAALGDAAAELGAGEPERVTQHPQERRVGGDVDRFALAVDGEADRGHDRTSSREMETTCTRGRADGRGVGDGAASSFIERLTRPPPRRKAGGAPLDDSRNGGHI